MQFLRFGQGKQEKQELSLQQDGERRGARGEEDHPAGGPLGRRGVVAVVRAAAAEGDQVVRRRSAEDVTEEEQKEEIGTNARRLGTTQEVHFTTGLWRSSCCHRL